jgi:predicted nuclease of restriction endonuclease-like (RecB) superfamily
MKQNSIDLQFNEITQLINQSRQKALRAVNTALIDLYWQLGRYISEKIASAEWGEGVVADLAKYLAKTQPGLRGFTRDNLFRMRQFYDVYHQDTIVGALARQLTWTNNMLILGRAKYKEEREFYLKLAVQEQWSSRELERQIKAALFERAVLSPPKASAALTQHYPEAMSHFKDTYTLDFLGLSDNHAEADLHKALLHKLKSFLTELGRDFCFIASEFPLQVGKRDFSLDLLFFHRGLNCLVAFELKVGEFEPGHLGQLSFYLEALDRNVKKSHEEPSIGILLCANKDDEVVEFALNRTLSPALITEYKTHLPDKALLQAKLHEFYQENVCDKIESDNPALEVV